MNRAVTFAPIGALFVIGAIGAWQLFDPNKGNFERASRDAPTIQFDTLEGELIQFAPPQTNSAIAVNLFASWCAPCEVEHKFVSALSAENPGRVFGVLYKDTPENGRRFLERLGNPYTQIALDQDGQGGLEFGLTGVPETFVISADGKILEHIAGPLDEAATRRVDEALNSAPSQ